MSFFEDLLKKGNNDALALPDGAEYIVASRGEQAPDNGATGNSGSGIEDIPLDNVEKSIRPSISDMIKHSAVKRAFGSQVSPEEIERVVRPSVPTFDIGSFVPEDLGADTTPLDNIRGEQVVEQEPAGQLQQAAVSPELPDFQTWLAQQGVKYGDVGDVLGYDFKQAKQDYEDFVDPEARARREKAAESRRRLAALGDIGLVIGDIVGAAAGGNVNRRGKSAGEMDYALRQAEENKALQREALLLQRYRQAADRGIANARQDYAQVMQRYLSDQQNALKRAALVNEAIKEQNAHELGLAKLALEGERLGEVKRHNQASEATANKNAESRNNYYLSVQGQNKRAIDNYEKRTFPIMTVNDEEVRVSLNGIGSRMGRLLSYTGGGSSSYNSPDGTILGEWGKIKDSVSTDKGTNSKFASAIKRLEQTAGILQRNKGEDYDRTAVQDYVSAILGLYNVVNEEGFKATDKKGRDVDITAFKSVLRDNVYKCMNIIEDVAQSDYDAIFSREYKSPVVNYTGVGTFDLTPGEQNEGEEGIGALDHLAVGQ